ncbi:hypothetical protein, conserved [Babesia ovata]|uniref:6-Cys domain-containing protein n=1 Tax=Babesia ovata TaxID=189622 RepID=A0A2H6KBW6_9APIC|nr:uncharacterized protein BOVATA_019810 [Babesia ovata]GBE60488.1 hypothetical protein, conserved [Babesia ovata]
MNIGYSSFATMVCPRRINDTDYIWHPHPTEDDQTQIETYVSEDWKLRSVPLSDVIVTEVPLSFVWTESNESFSILNLNLRDYEIYVINQHRMIFICGPKDLVLSDTLQRHLERINGIGRMKPLPWVSEPSLTEEIKKIGKGLGVVFLYGGHMYLPLQGCGSRPSPLFAADNEVYVDPVTGTRSCVADPMSKSRIGFICDGIIEPIDCMASLLDKNGGVVTPPRPYPYWSFNNNRPWVVANYFDKLPLTPLNGECKCIDPETGQVKARIEIRSKTEYVCDIASKIFRNRVRPIIGHWCSVVLHPGSTLTIRVPAKIVNSTATDGGFDDDINKDSPTVTLSQLPSIYEYETEFMPKDLTTLWQLIAPYGADIYDEAMYHHVVAGDALELDLFKMSQGEVKLKYHKDKPLALRSGYNSFFYHWTLVSRNENVPDKIRATINVSFAFNHEYTKVGCDRGQRHVFDQHLSENYCTNKLMSNDIGSIYECVFNLWRAEWKTGIYCSPDEELLPNNCESTAYDLSSDRIVPLPMYVRNATSYPIRGFQVFDFEFRRDIPISYACFCVDQRGYEKSRLILESYDKLSRNYVVRRKTRFRRLLPYVTLPWRKVGLLLEGLTSARVIVLRNTSKKTFRLHVGTKLLLRCGTAAELRNVGRHENITTTWLPKMPNEFHYAVTHTSHGRELVRRSHKEAVATTPGGLEVKYQEIERGPGYQTVEITSHRDAVLIYKGPVHTRHVPMRFVCGKVPETSELSIVTANAPSSDASAQPISNITEMSEEYTWTIVKVKVETTDPYMQGCGVTYESTDLFKPETPQLYDGDGQPQFGCKIDLQAANEAAFYCPAPYVLDPPICFSQVYVDGEVRSMSDLSESLVVSRSNHFVILSFDSSFVGVGETLRQTPPLECRCVTVKGVVLSTIQIENYYSK